MSGAGSAKETRRELGRHLQELRKQAGLSQRQVARQTGCTRSAVSNAEAGGYAGRRFWERCDDLLATGGVLARGHDAIHQQNSGAPGSARQALDLLEAARGPDAVGQALAAYQKLGWPVEENRGHLVLVTGTVIDALELPRPAGDLAARWWLYTGGRADAVRGLPSLPRPDQALAVIEAGPSSFFIAQASGSPHVPGPADPAGASTATGPAIRWHCRGSQIILPPSNGGDGQAARWAHLPTQRLGLAPAIGLLDLLAKAAATVRPPSGALSFARDVLVIPIHGQPSPAPTGQPQEPQASQASGEYRGQAG